jgi:DNA polymerase-3 subunit alpha
LDVWRQIESFAGYAFSKGHSASYAVESYQSLYLKAHYPLEYMTATINNFGGYYRTEIYVHEARRFGAEIEAPSVNHGSYECVLSGNTLILGFNLVAGIEASLVLKIFEERDRAGEFRDFEDFVRRVHVPLEQTSLLIRIGALRDFPEKRKELLWKAHFHHHKNPQRDRSIELFEVRSRHFELPDLEEQEEEASFEQMELMGFPLCNPFRLLQSVLPAQHVKAVEMESLLGMTVELFGYLVAIKQSKTAKGALMNFGTFIDVNGDTIDTVHFPESVRRFPFHGKGIYHLRGVVTEEFSYYCLQVGWMQKLPFQQDVRYMEL